MRTPPRAALVAVFGAVIFGSCGGAAIAKTLPANARAAATSATQTLASSIAVFESEQAVHYVSTSAQGGMTTAVSGDAGRTTGLQTLTLHGGTAAGAVQLRLVGGVAYVNESAATLTATLGFPAYLAARESGKWISISHSDKPYASTATGATLASVASELVVPGVLSPTATGVVISGTKKIDGISAEDIHGHGVSSGEAVSVDLYVQQGSPALPILETGSIAQGASRGSFTIRFTDWNEHLTVTPPKGPTAYAALVASANAVGSCNADAKTVEVALSAYDAQKGHYPTGRSEAATEALLVPSFLRTWPRDPAHYVVTLGGTTSGGRFTANGTVLVSANGGKPTSYDVGHERDLLDGPIGPPAVEIG